MKSLLIIVSGLVVTGVLTDVRSTNGVFNLLMPFLCVLFAIALMIWLAFALAGKRIEGKGSPKAPDILGHKEPWD